LADPEKTGEMTRRGRQEVADRFSLARSAEAIKEEIKSFLVR
jgi:hypothetical protein